MIYYFSGTGNSQWVAEQLTELLNEPLISIADAMADSKFRYMLNEGEKIGWVFPTYSWGPAPIVLDFIKKWHIDGCSASTYCYMVTTCGDDIGQSVEMWSTAIGDFIPNKAAFSIQMPNNYILLPGFDVDSHDVEIEKKRKAILRVEEIAASIAENRCTEDVVTGKWTWIKSRVIYPLFRKYYMKDNDFTVNESKCTHCGICQKKCPTRNISLNGKGIPEWHGDCAMCLSCIHRCPPRAIEYGKQSQKKGRYYFKKLR